ncbi:hypothetical protein [[Flexibacter] sp. ATCC 35208]|uniref:hypothetical protein n=1 Tax=[Flexibacter] sp. ATCC 35208 TaxID=1936242 RepID=UPI0009CF4603|nr:hypothetical protein [[Flexibacter] sp. ATCC 35208]OMP79279.1 hypothetical protein BW716_10505 [[Flexibacter] sp. ATCC 35208]
MDRKKLKELLQPFLDKCSEKGKPLANICIEEAFPGDSSTSFIVQVKADWVDGAACSDALDFLFEILWETTSEEIRRNVFSIQILNSHDVLHCWSDTPAA